MAYKIRHMASPSNRMPSFSTVVSTVLNNWTALQLAVQHQLGGPESKQIAEWMVEIVENFFYENDDVIGQEVADYIGEVMNNEFNTVCEDGSLEEVGDNICKYFNLLKKGNIEDVLTEIGKLKGSGVDKCKLEVCEVESVETEDGIMDVVTPMNNLNVSHESTKVLKNQPDEDGWITVSKGKK